MWFILVILFTSVVFLWKYYMEKIYSYFEKQGIDTPPYYYIFGNVFEQFLFKKHLGVILKNYYDSFQGYNYFGFYNFTNKSVVLRNPDIIKDILVNNFSHFTDNDITIHEDDDPIMGKNPFALKGRKWKTVRTQMTHTLSTGKVKMMVPVMIENTKKLVKYLQNNSQREINAKDLCYRFTCENVAACAFGLEGRSFESDDATFLVLSKELFKNSFWESLKIVAVFVFPQLATIFKIRFFSRDFEAFLTSLVANTLKYRVEADETRNDFLDAMREMLVKINNEKEFGMKDIVGHAGGLFLDGVETTSSFLQHFLYEIAANRKEQERLREEIRQVLKIHGKITYESIQDMHFLECCFKEALRLHLPLLFASKQVTKEYTLGPMKEDNSGPKLSLKVGDSVIIPSYALHHDPAYFPDPYQFNPDRFSEQNKENISKFTYLPFGEGPRICLGMKFGSMQCKIAIVALVNSFEMSVNSRTENPVEIDPGLMLNTPKNGYWIDFQTLDY